MVDPTGSRPVRAAEVADEGAAHEDNVAHRPGLVEPEAGAHRLHVLEGGVGPGQQAGGIARKELIEDKRPERDSEENRNHLPEAPADISEHGGCSRVALPRRLPAGRRREG